MRRKGPAFPPALLIPWVFSGCCFGLWRFGCYRGPDLLKHRSSSGLVAASGFLDGSDGRRCWIIRCRAVQGQIRLPLISRPTAWTRLQILSRVSIPLNLRPLRSGGGLAAGGTAPLLTAAAEGD
jgi:hypothetical protein